MAQHKDYSPVLIRFICPDCGEIEKKDTDHLLYIKRNQDNFTWSYSDTDRTKAQYMEFADGTAVLNALERTFHLLSWDTDPYEGIQIDAPGYPMVFLKMSDMKDWWPTVRPFLEGVFDNWPLNTTRANVLSSDDDLANPAIDARDEEGCACGCLEDEDDESENEEGQVTESDSDTDRTDPDMPALMRLEEILRQASHRDTNTRAPYPTEDLLYAKRRINAETNTNSTNWIEEGEERQRKEPIEIRRTVNTPNGPRTHIRFV